MRNSYRLVVLLAVVVGAMASPVRAEEDPWRFNITPYLWLPSLDSHLSIDDIPLEVDSDADAFNVLDYLDFGLLICGEVRKGKFGLLYDVQYLKFSDDDTTSEADQRDYEVDITVADTTLGLQYRVIEKPKFSLDAFGGARIFYVSTELDLDAGAVTPAESGDQNKSWVDPIVGIKCRYHMGRKWGLNGYGDIGGFGVGSDLTYQLLGTVSYSFNDNIAMHLGYRAFAVDFEEGGFAFDVMMYGPLVGLTFSF